ncbi:MAG: PhzF family phenazine biosynthesis protein [Paludibacter sp.]
MDKTPLYQVDAFTNELFKGNPAAVCILKNWLNDSQMQQIAAENNLAETAFVVAKEDIFQIRWFTPTIEVDLCGHATLASAFVLFNCMNYEADTINFYSPRSGELTVSRQGDTLFLDFPSDILQEQNNTEEIAACIGILPISVYKGKSDFMAVLENEQQILNLHPNLAEIVKLSARGLIVTAPGMSVDFVSRFFAPQSGIDEDPVTGSAHTTLIPYWSKKLGKTEMTARQLSKRGGNLTCRNNGTRCLIGGKARLYLTGEININ